MSLSLPGVMRLSVLFGIALGGAHTTGSPAHESRSFIAGAAGYGVEECLDEVSECGRLVACDEHDHGVAVKFGRTEDHSGAVSNISWSAPRSYYIVCSD